MRKDGICQVTDTRFTKTIQYLDINYLLAQNEDQEAIFGGWCGFLNFFDSSINAQMTFVNQSGGRKSAEESVVIPPREDQDDYVRNEYSEMLQTQQSRGNNGLSKTKYLTFGIEASSLKTAKARLDRIESDILGNFKRLGVPAEPLNGKERLRVMHSIFHMDGREKFLFEWDWLVPTGLRTKDFIAPSFEFGEGRKFRIGDKYAAVSYLQILTPELHDRMLSDFLDTEHNVVVNLHIQSMDQITAIKDVKRKITDLDSMKIVEQKKAVQAGYDADILPSDLATYGGDAKNLLKELQSRNERMFMLTFLIMNVADTPRTLENMAFQMQGIAQKYNCMLSRLDFQQESGMVSSLPLGRNLIEIQRGLTTSAAAILIPFTTQELFQRGPEALYYGLNALSNNLIMVDRKLLKTPNGLILGTPGSGKSFAAKREITNVYLVTNDDVAIADPEGEYFALVQRLGGQVIRISASSKDYINPLDINLNYSDDDSPLRLKAEFIFSMCELMVDRRDGLAALERNAIDRVIPLIYKKYIGDPKPENMPVLEDLYDALMAQKEKNAHFVAKALEIYVHGSLNVFNHQTNVDVQNRLVCYDIKDLGNTLKKLGMLVIQDQVWGRVTANRAAGKSTRYYCDEFHLLLKEPQTAAYSIEIWKRFRKWGGIPTGITQNVKDLLAAHDVENIFENSDFILLLNQASGDREILAKKLNISKQQLSFVMSSGEGEGLMIYDGVILPFFDKFPKDTELYRIMTSKLSESKAQGGS